MNLRVIKWEAVGWHNLDKDKERDYVTR